MANQKIVYYLQELDQVCATHSHQMTMQSEQMINQTGEKLGRLGTIAVPDLIGLLNHSKWEFVWAAVIGLGIIRDRRATLPLLAAMERYFEKTKGLSVSFAIKAALINLADPNTVEELYAIYQRWHNQDQHGFIAIDIAEILVAIGGRNASKYVIEIAVEWEGLIAKALSQIDSTIAFDGLNRIIHNPKTPIHRRSAIFMLGAVNDERVITTLVRFLLSENLEDQLAAIRGLGLAGNIEGYEPLLGIRTKTDNPTVREYIREALKKIRKQQESE